MGVNPGKLPNNLGIIFREKITANKQNIYLMLRNNNSPPKYISLFSGAGGLDLGLDHAGYERLLAIELDAVCVDTLIKNGAPLETVVNADISKCSSAEIKEWANLKDGETIDLLAGGPPCQPFSKSSFWINGDTLRMDDPRSSALIELMRLVRDLKPLNVLIENVIGIKFRNKDEGYNYIRKQFEKINNEHGTRYKLTTCKVNAADYGVPQNRERLFIIANIKGKEFQMPQPTHGKEKDQHERDIEDYMTAWDAIGDLENVQYSQLTVTSKWGDLLPSIPQGNNYLWHTNRMGGKPLFGWRTRYWSFLLKLDKHRPSWTITANPGSANGPFHWNNRKLSEREMARLQTFPDWYKFEGNYSQVRMQLGNAVPPLLAEFLGAEIRKQLIDGTNSSCLKLSIGKNLKPPTEEKLSAVAEKYLDMIGDHMEHPGTGKGPGAMQRND